MTKRTPEDVSPAQSLIRFWAVVWVHRSEQYGSSFCMMLRTYLHFHL
jgi:hypothetical protein